MFENKVINGVHTSRYIMSWLRSGGTFGRRGEGYYEFKEWLDSLGLEDEDAEYIVQLARNGRMELETSAKLFIKNRNAK